MPTRGDQGLRRVFPSVELTTATGGAEYQRRQMRCKMRLQARTPAIWCSNLVASALWKVERGGTREGTSCDDRGGRCPLESAHEQVGLRKVQPKSARRRFAPLGAAQRWVLGGESRRLMTAQRPRSIGFGQGSTGRRHVSCVWTEGLVDECQEAREPRQR